MSNTRTPQNRREQARLAEQQARAAQARRARLAVAGVVLEDGDNVVVAYGEDGSFPTQPPTDALDAA